MKKYIALLLALLCLFLPACGGSSSESEAPESAPDATGSKAETSAVPSADTKIDDGTGNVRLTFAESIDMARIEELSGRTVEMIGYMATISPVNGQYLYLMNLPYQSCPYCVPNTQQLSNTIAVYAKEGQRFEFTDAPINVVGILETGDFEDEYSYTYNYRIKDATYTTVTSTEASEKLALWEKISNSGLASDVYKMFDFVTFECNWPNYTAQFQDGVAHLYPADVAYFEEKQFTTESAADYFDSLAKRAKEVDDDVMDELVEIINDGKTLKEKAVAERTKGNYTYDKEADIYTLTNGEELMTEVQDLYYRYAVWLENFSLSK